MHATWNTSQPHLKKNASFVGNTRILPNHLVNMNEHHKGIAFTRSILFLLQERMNQLWCIRNEEVEVSGEEKWNYDDDNEDKNQQQKKRKKKKLKK